MASQGPNELQNAAAVQVSGQSQMTRDQNPQPSNPEGQGGNFLQETGNQVKSVAQGAAGVGLGAAQGAVNLARGAVQGAANMSQGAAGVGMGAAQGAVNLARGAVQGAANMSQGAVETVKNTLGINNSEDQPPLSTAACDATATSLPGHPHTRI